MKNVITLAVIIALAGCAHMQESPSKPDYAAGKDAGVPRTKPAPAKAPAASADISAPALQAILKYEFGQSREPLTVVEDLVRESLKSPDQSRQLAAQLSAILSANATPACKQFVCRQLVLVGGAENVPAIAPLLLNADTADMARYALQPIPGPEVDQALLSALPQAPDAAKPGIINSLGARHCRAALKELKKYTTHPDSATAEAARAAIQRIRD